MRFQKASEADFYTIQKFYWDVIENIHRNNVNNENLGWEKGVYPSDQFIQDSLIKGELYTLIEKDTLCACVILNSEHNEEYDSCTWALSVIPMKSSLPMHLLLTRSCKEKVLAKL